MASGQQDKRRQEEARGGKRGKRRHRMAWGHELVWAQETCQEILRGRRSQHAGNPCVAGERRLGYQVKDRAYLGRVALGED